MSERDSMRDEFSMTRLATKLQEFKSRDPAPVTDKRGYAERWGFSLRTVDNLLAKGLPHLKIGARRVRIEIAAADQWMRQTFGVQRRK